MNDRKVPLCFVERLTVVSWIFCVLPYILQQRMKYPRALLQNMKFKIYFVDAGKPALAFAGLGARVLGGVLERFQFSLVDVKDDERISMRLRTAYFHLVKIQQDILASDLFKCAFDNPAVQDKTRMFLAKQIIDGDITRRVLVLIHAIAQAAAREGTTGTFFMNRRVWIEEISRYALGFGVKIIPTVNLQFNRKEFLSGLLGKRNIRVLKNIYGFYLQWGRKKSSLTAKSTRAPESPKLTTEYYGDLNLDRPGLHSNVFFWQQSSLVPRPTSYQGLAAQDILMTFHIPRDPLDERKWIEISSHGMRAVVLEPRATTMASSEAFYHWPPRLRVNLNDRRHKRSRTLEARWLKRQILNYEQDYHYWVDFFTRYNVKIYLTWCKYDAAHFFIADALAGLGGVTAIYQRAFEEFPAPETVVACDITFGFSPKCSKIEMQSGSVIPYHVVTGYLGDYRFPLLKPEALQIKSQLRARGAKHILAFFDENSGSDPRWAIGHDFVRADYAFLLEKVLQEPWFGLVLKPKVPATLQRRLGPVANLLKEAEETGRCFVFREGTLQSAYPPAMAALCADIAVHGHLCAATAGLEAALTGTPTLLLDREGWRVSSLYQLGVGRVVFTNWPDLWKVCQDHWKTSLGVPGLGDWSTMIHEIDPFCDGRAAERIGTYLKWLLDGFKMNTSRETILADAAERYAKIWGKDKISSVNCKKSEMGLQPAVFSLQSSED